LTRKTSRQPAGWGRAVVGLALALAAGFAPASPQAIDAWYSDRWYRAIQPFVTGFSSLVPVALLDVWIVVALVVVAWWGWRIARAPRGQRGRLTGAAVAGVVFLASAIYLIFLLCWGLNYRRLPITSTLDFAQSRVSESAVESAAARAVAALNHLHDPAHRELNAFTTLATLRVALAPAFADAQRALGRDPFARAGRPKTSMLSPFFRWAAVDGMVNPLGLEVILNPEVLPVERPFVLAHEWGHLAGWARESEASYVAWLTCRASGASAQYSGWLSLYWHLRRDVSRQAVADFDRQLGPGPRRDMAAIAARLSRGQPLVQEASWRTYDQFLKANRVPSGIKSYDEVVTLVVGTGTDVLARPTLPN
jgi:hypothetical protein